jgi:hypothetical protein
MPKRRTPSVSAHQSGWVAPTDPFSGRSFRRGCLHLLTPGSSRHEAKLKNPASSECQNDNRPEDHREQERYGKGQMPMENHEVHLHALEVLKDKNEDHDQGYDANDEGRPCSTEASSSLAPVRCPSSHVLIRWTCHNSGNTRVLAASQVLWEGKTRSGTIGDPSGDARAPPKPPPYPRRQLP